MRMMTASDKWLILTALERYAKDMRRAEECADNIGTVAIAKSFRERAEDAEALHKRISLGGMDL